MKRRRIRKEGNMAEMNREYGRKPDRELLSGKGRKPDGGQAGYSGRGSFMGGVGGSGEDGGETKGKFTEDIRQGWKRIREHLGMDKLLLIFLAGILLLLSSFPFGKKAENDGGGQQGGYSAYGGDAGSGSAAAGPGSGQSRSDPSDYAAWLEERLETVLLSVDGVGNVRVMITLKNNGEKQLQSDTVRERSSTGETDSAGGSRTVQEGREEYSTVILNNGTGDGPYVTRETAPEIEGVLVVAQGAGSSSVKTEIYEAVQALFNVPAHKIKVLKGVLEN